jgi:tetratricopeptide (TPR) repeat protein
MQDYAGAAATLRKALEMSPRDLDVKKNLAEDLLMSDQTDAALKLYEEVAQADPKDVRVPLRLSQIYRQKHELGKAREAQDRASSLEPDSLEVRYNEVNLLEAEGKTTEAIGKLKELLDVTAKKSYAQGEQANRAILVERLGLLHRSVEQFPEAIQAFQTLQELEPKSAARASAQIVDTWRQAKEYTKAQQAADEAAKKFPNDRTLTLVRASLLADTGRADAAAAEVRKLLKGDNDRDTLLALAQIYDKGKDYAEMSRTLDEAEKLSRTEEERETVHFMRGAMLEKMKKLDEAEAEFRKVLELNPDNASALNYLGYMFADRNVRLEEARKLITRALELEPNNGAYLDSLGWVNYRLGRLEEAEQALRRALERVSRDPIVHDHLGDVLSEQGKLKEAIAQWEISLREWDSGPQADHDPVEVAKIQKKLESAKVRLAKESSVITTPR